MCLDTWHVLVTAHMSRTFQLARYVCRRYHPNQNELLKEKTEEEIRIF